MSDDTAETMENRVLLPGQTCVIRVFDLDTQVVTTVHESTDTLFEAPNWSRDDQLIVNANGALWSLPSNGSAVPTRIPIDGVPDLNNDHVLASSGDGVFVSANDFHIYKASLAGGTARRITEDDGSLHFLHGVSPNGSTLAYVRLEPNGDDWWASATIHEIDVDGSGDRAVTTHPGPADGPEYSPDGEWIYFNTEQFEKGRAQISRIRPDGSGLEQLTFNERVNWFPHLSPTGGAAVYLSFPQGTEGHPADKMVQLVLVTDDNWEQGRVVAEFNGGQGTLNVNSWAIDGRAFAFVEYPIASS